MLVLFLLLLFFPFLFSSLNFLNVGSHSLIVFKLRSSQRIEFLLGFGEFNLEFLNLGAWSWCIQCRTFNRNSWFNSLKFWLQLCLCFLCELCNFLFPGINSWTSLCLVEILFKRLNLSNLVFLLPFEFFDLLTASLIALAPDIQVSLKFFASILCNRKLSFSLLKCLIQSVKFIILWWSILFDCQCLRLKIEELIGSQGRLLLCFADVAFDARNFLDVARDNSLVAAHAYLLVSCEFGKLTE